MNNLRFVSTEVSFPNSTRRLQISNDVSNSIGQNVWTLWDMSTNGVIDHNDIGAQVDLSSSEWYLPPGDYLCVADVNASCAFSGSNSAAQVDFYLNGSSMTGARISFHRTSGDRAIYCEKISVNTGDAISLYGYINPDCSGSTGDLNSCTIVIVEAVN